MAKFKIGDKVVQIKGAGAGYAQFDFPPEDYPVLTVRYADRLSFEEDGCTKWPGASETRFELLPVPAVVSIEVGDTLVRIGRKYDWWTLGKEYTLHEILPGDAPRYRVLDDVGDPVGYTLGNLLGAFSHMGKPVVDTPTDAKHDGGKPIAGALYEYFPRAINEVNKVSTFGAVKYERGSFKYVPNGLERYNDAFHRHLLAEASGEVLDEESGLMHAAHAAWGALCRLEFLLTEENNE